MPNNTITIGGITKSLNGEYQFRVKCNDINIIKKLKDGNIQYCIVQGMKINEEYGYYDPKETQEILTIWPAMNKYENHIQIKKHLKNYKVISEQ